MLPQVPLAAGVRLPEEGVHIVAQTEAGHLLRVHDDREKVLVASQIHLKYKVTKNVSFTQQIIKNTDDDKH